MIELADIQVIIPFILLRQYLSTTDRQTLPVKEILLSFSFIAVPYTLVFYLVKDFFHTRLEYYVTGQSVCKAMSNITLTRVAYCLVFATLCFFYYLENNPSGRNIDMTESEVATLLISIAANLFGITTLGAYSVLIFEQDEREDAVRSF
ncbi:hypothetical protein AB4K20DRAFT_1990107 [Rhizopus microsporus]|uniref:Uncharacterized protein n=1 Tax=Rhizopus microsporus TaxID=58291 RepID=A0A1X0S2M5_RHIZD|nr:hypothetical protein BCV71DRAFT_234862 [Rhizopus microsporus]